MRVPLAAYARKNSICIVRNKKIEEVPLPIPPVCYIKHGLGKLPYGENPIWENYVDLWTKEPIKVYPKTNFKTPMDAYYFFKANKESEYVYANTYMEQVLIQLPEFFNQYPNNEPLTTLTFDIEVYNDGDGSFPRAETNPIIAIAYKINDEPVQVIDCYDDNKKDKFIIEEFLRAYTKHDPDVVVGYNCMGQSGEGFDFPYLLTRCKKLHIDPNCLGRFGVPIKIEKDRISIFGRCIFDVLNFIWKDQSLSGIKNRKLETVAKWYNIDTFKSEDIYKTNSDSMIRTETLKKHVTSDVDATYKLSKIYFLLRQSLAEMMAMPLEKSTNCYPSFIPKIFAGRNLFPLKMIPFQSNIKRYGDTKFQAALSNVKKVGYHPKIWDIDAASFYPSLMRTFNLSPECVQMVNRLPFTGKFDFKSDGKYLFARIPDENFKVDILLKINLKIDGFLRTEMDNFFDKRNELKEQLKLAKTDSEKAIFKSQSDSIKVLMNSIFGAQGLGVTWVGDMAVGIGIAGLARWILGSVIDYYGDNTVGYDTDGIYVDRKPNIDEINKFVADLIWEKTKVKSRITFEFKTNKKGKSEYSCYYYKAKNYVLKDEDGELEFHGVSMKSSRSAPLYDKTIRLVTDAIMSEASEIEITNLSTSLISLKSFTLDDFLMRTRVTKYHPEQAKALRIENEDEIYKNAGALQPTLIKRTKILYNKDLKIGDTIEYYRTYEGYRLKDEIENTEKLDMKYYKDMTSRALSIFKADLVSLHNKKQGVFDFMIETKKETV